MFHDQFYSFGESLSSIRQLSEYAARRKAEIGEENVFDFSIGNPSVPPPDLLDQTIIDIISSKTPGIHGYTTAAGIPSLRQKISQNLKDTYDLDADTNLIFVTGGAAGALATSLRAILEPGDEVIMPSPFFSEYRVYVEAAGARLMEIQAIQNFHIDPDELEKIISPKTRAIIINSPNNPTGAVLKKEDLKIICEILKKHSAKNNRAIYIVSDEPYREIVYDGIKVPCILKYYDDSIMCYSFSKSLSIPGERMGYIVVNSSAKDAKRLYSCIKGVSRVYGYVNPSSLFQRVLERCIGMTSDISEYAKNRKILCDGLGRIGYEFVPPDGAFYLFVKALEPDAKAFSKQAMKHELMLVPSDEFGCTGYVRISFCVSESLIRNSMPAFKALYDEYRP